MTAASQELDRIERSLQVSADSSLSVVLSGLEEYTLYSVVLSAATSAGSGPETVATARTNQSGTLYC